MSQETLKSTRLNGGEFLIKESTPDQVFTIEDISEEQRMMAESTKEFIDKEVWPKKSQFENKDYVLVENLMKQIGELGLLGVSIPEEYGGLGMGFSSTMLICDYISGATGSLGTAFGAHTGIGTMPILLYGNEAQKAKYLPKLATGEWFASYCLTEPEAGSDANGGRTTAKLTEDGKHYVLNGQKMWITNAGFAHLFIVFAKIDDDKNLTGFILEKDQAGEGFSLGEEEHKLGIVSSSTRQVFFNDVKVPVENLLGERNGGFKIAMNALNVGRVKLGAATLDSQRRILNKAIQYSNERKQFKVPLSSFGAVQQKIAEIAIKTFVSEAAAYRVAKDIEDAINDNLAAGLNHSEAELKGIEEYAMESSIIKVWNSEAAQFSSDEGIQIMGGLGYSKEMPMESAWRDARIARIYEGTNEINRLVLISMLIKRAFKGRIDLMSPAKNVLSEMMSIPSFDTPNFSELFAQEKLIITNLKKAFFMVAGAALQKFGPELEKHQQLILCASEIMMEIYMAESTILRAEKLASARGAKLAIDIAKIQLFDSVEKIKTFGTRGIVSFAEGDEQRMMLSGLRRFTKYFEYPNVIKLKTDLALSLIEEGKYTY